MKYLVFKQKRALKGKIVSVVILVFSVFMLVLSPEPLISRVLLFVVGLLIFGFGISYRIYKSFDNQKVFSLFGIPIFKTKLDIEFPDYISIFSASFSLDNDWGAIAALGTKERHDTWVVRFFKGNKNVTLYKTENYQKAINVANELGKMLELEVYDASKE